MDFGGVSFPYREQRLLCQLFKNKVDYATQFGEATEYKHSIHILPISPIFGYIRSMKFSREEWDEKLNPAIFLPKDKKQNAIIKASYSILDPEGTYDYFPSVNFDNGHMQEGESRAYYLMHAAALAGFQYVNHCKIWMSTRFSPSA